MGLSEVFSWLDWSYGFGGRLPQRWSALLVAWYWGGCTWYPYNMTKDSPMLWPVSHPSRHTWSSIESPSRHPQNLVPLYLNWNPVTTFMLFCFSTKSFLLQRFVECLFKHHQREWMKQTCTLKKDILKAWGRRQRALKCKMRYKQRTRWGENGSQKETAKPNRGKICDENSKWKME